MLHNVTTYHIVTDPNLKSQSIEYSFSTVKNVTTKIAYIKRSKNPLIKGARFYKAFKTMLKSGDTFDLVHLNVLFPFGIYALYMKLFYKVPYLISDHWSAYHNGRKRFSFLSRFLMINIAKYATFILPVSNDLGHSMRQMGLYGKYERVPNVVDTAVFSVNQTNKQSEKIIFLHISSMIDKIKNVSGILRALDGIDYDKQPYHCYFVGGESPVLNNNPNVTFIPHVDQTELVHYFHKSDVFLLFSNTENLPCVILESFSCGVPVVSTNVGGIPEYFPDDFGVLINVKDEKKLTKILQNWEKNGIDKVKMHQYVETHFSQNSIAKSFDEYYQEMIL